MTSMEQLEMKPVNTEELMTLAAENGPILFVYINDKTLGWRPGYVEGQMRTDLELYARVSRYWQVQRFLPDWAVAPVNAPKSLVAVALPPENRIVIASMKIRVKKDGMWDYTDNDLWKEGRMIVPVDLGAQENIDLNYLQLRGRKISGCGLSFNSIPSQEFCIRPSIAE